MAEEKETRQDRVATPRRCLRLEFADGSSFDLARGDKVAVNITRPGVGSCFGDSLADRFFHGSRYAGGKIRFGAYGEEATDPL
jgi:hypothetical protein